MHRALPQIATPRIAPQHLGRPIGRPPATAFTRQAPATPRTFAAPQQPRPHIAGPGNRGALTTREAMRPGLRDNLARQQQIGPDAGGRFGRQLPQQQQLGQRFQLAGADGNRTFSERVLRNQFLANRAAIAGPGGRAVARANFPARANFQGSFAGRHFARGHLAGQHWAAFAGKDWKHWRHWKHRRHFPLVVIGWAGPLFWPYAYDDFVGYTFYPYAYDTFWPNAYDDVYEGMFGRYAYGGGGGGTRYAAVGGRSAPTGRAPDGGGRTVATDLCSGQTAGLTDWPIEQIAQAVGPDDAQRAALDELRSATAKALDILKASCPSELPSTPTGRLEAMHKRLDAMLAAVRTVRPALDKFYQALNDEQKARFNAFGSDDERVAQQTQRELSQACGERASGIGGLPIDRIERAVRPDDAQRVSLNELKDATAAAIERLKSECPTYRPLTPAGRLEAMEQRLDTMLRAVETVQPALQKFYGALNDEQKERFNRLSPAQS